MQAVKRHLDALQDGVFSPEALRRRADGRCHPGRQGRSPSARLRGGSAYGRGHRAHERHAAATQVSTQLAAERPWREIGALDPDLAEIRACYGAERQRLLQWQEQQAEAARGRVRARDGFSTLTADQAHSVLRPFTEAVTDTTAEAVAPPLTALADPFTLALQRAESQANDLLDEILSEGDRPLIARVDLQLRNREVATEAEVEALVEEIRERLLEQVRAGHRVRLL